MRHAGLSPFAYASGDAASGAYWIAAAADEIVVSKTSALGSIGVVGVYRGNKGENVVEVVSSQSPYKRLDPDTDDGRARLQSALMRWQMSLWMPLPSIAAWPPAMYKTITAVAMCSWGCCCKARSGRPYRLF